MRFHSIKEVDVNNKFVLLRADLNVPTKAGKITDTARIDRLKKTVDLLVKGGAKLIILSHFGRPKGITPEFSQKFMTPSLETAWGHKVNFANDIIGQDALQKRNSMRAGDILLLENIRFDPREEMNDPAFAKELAKLGDIYVNDAFSVSHRAHASTEAIALLLPAYAGLLMIEELDALEKALERPKRPVMAVVGGAKISTKLDLLNNLVLKVDVLVLGGGMANTFLHAMGYNVGASLCEKDMAKTAQQIIARAAEHKCTLVLPEDVVAADSFAAHSPHDVYDIKSVPANRMILDIGPRTIEAIECQIRGCETVIWNGPMGAFELKPFDHGTNEVARYVAENTQSRKMVSVAGGGDTVSALDNASMADKFSYLSTAGGAFLEWMEGKKLPGVMALKSKGSKVA
jgi:phosphoglycerate kinase